MEHAPPGMRTFFLSAAGCNIPGSGHFYPVNRLPAEATAYYHRAILQPVIVIDTKAWKADVAG
ncbi:MAG: hypothetical protein U0V75_14445 [Ferruginibacter sp.]